MLTGCSRRSEAPSLLFFLLCFFFLWHMYSQTAALSIIYNSLHPGCAGWQRIWVLGMLGNKKKKEEEEGDRWHHSAAAAVVERYGTLSTRSLSRLGGGRNGARPQSPLFMVRLCLWWSVAEHTHTHTHQTATTWYGKLLEDKDSETKQKLVIFRLFSGYFRFFQQRFSRRFLQKQTRRACRK